MNSASGFLGPTLSPQRGPGCVAQHPGRCCVLFQSPQTPAALLTSAGRSLAYLAGIPYGARPCPHPGPSIQSSPGLRTLTFPRTRPPRCVLLSGLRAQPTRGSFIAQAAPAGVVVSPLPPMAARFGRAQDGGDISPSASGRGRVEGRYLGGAGTAGTLRAVISFCWGALWRLQARKGGARLGRYGSGLTAL